MNEQIDASIPVLTEIIHTPNGNATEAQKVTPSFNTNPMGQRTSATSAAASTSLNFAPQALIRESSDDASNSRIDISPLREEQEKAPELDSDEWLLMEQTVRENVLKQVLTRIDFVLEHRVSDSLADVLQKAVDQLADDIRAGLKQSIEEVVTRAVNQEIAKLKSPR
ncbi:MAG: hypothetical protein E6Q34_10465 [Burkholderiaceae bacterium]|nr:MAG: hypothetical protein E6Q34_10465 [Burkholderiaceae bacterium]